MSFSVSFCIPTYKRYETLVLALESILGQEGLGSVDYEVIISDDANNIQIQEYIKKKSDSRIRYVQTNKHGQFNNLDNLVLNASKEWLVFLHDDDLLKPGYLSNLLLVGKGQYAGARAFFSDREYISQNGRLIKDRTFDRRAEEVQLLDGKKVFDRLFFGGFYKEKFSFTTPMLTGLAVKKGLVQTIGGFDGRLPVNADALFLNEVSFTADKILYINKPLVSYRVVGDSERGKPSKQGIVYDEMKKLFTYTLDFVEGKMDETDFKGLKERKTEHFYKNCMAVNGPILWIALRYEGGYAARITILKRVVRDIMRGYPKSKLSAGFYIILLVALLPKQIMEFIYKASNA